LGYQSNAYTPTYRGFDTYTGYYSGAEEHFTHYKAGEGKNYFDLANNSGNSVAPLFSMVGKTQNETEEYYSVYVYGNETVRLIKRHAALYASSPLYVYLAWNVVHAPDEAPATGPATGPEGPEGPEEDDRIKTCSVGFAGCTEMRLAYGKAFCGMLFEDMCQGCVLSPHQPTQQHSIARDCPSPMT
jgi:hypothetical protein